VRKSEFTLGLLVIRKSETIRGATGDERCETEIETVENEKE
jgi:hypothetical protein